MLRIYCLPYNQKSCNSKHQHTPPIGWQNWFAFWKSRIKFHTEVQPFWIWFVYCLINIYYYATTTSFLTLPFFYKLKKASCADEYCANKINPLFPIIYELQWTVQSRMQLVTCWLTFLTLSEKNVSSCTLLNAFITNPEHIGRIISRECTQIKNIIFNVIMNLQYRFVFIKYKCF